jgi:hypothetical protein
VPKTLYFRLYWTLVASFVALGACLAFVQPVYSVPDEATHWIAAHTRMEHLLGREGCVPFFDPERNRRHHQPMPSFEVQTSTPLTCQVGGGDLYGDIFTYPGALVAKLLVPNQDDMGSSQLLAILVTRLSQGLLVVLCLVRIGALAQRARTYGALLAASFALSPLFAQQAFGVSSDGAQLCFGLYLFAAILYWEHLSLVDVAAFFFFGLGAAAKPFIVVCVVPSVLAGFWFAQLRSGEVASPGAVLRRLVQALRPRWRPGRDTLLLWASILLSAHTAVAAMRVAISGGTDLKSRGVDQTEQLALVEAEPSILVEVALAQNPPPWRLRSYAGPLGWLDTRLSPATTKGFVRLVRFAAVFEFLFLLWIHRTDVRTRLRSIRVRLRPSLLPALLGIAGPLLNGVVIPFLLYLSWTKVGARVPAGMQARYYFASVLVLFAAVAATFHSLFGKVSGTASPEAAAQPEAADSAARKRFQAVARAVFASSPAIVLALVVPYIARVFLDLARRYY